MKPDVVRRLSASVLGFVTDHIPREQAADVDTTPRSLTVEETHLNILEAMQAMARSRTAK
jgi:hypothetical protein